VTPDAHWTDDTPCDAPKTLVDFSGNLYGAHDIARNLGATCPYCGITFKFWGDEDLKDERGAHGNLARIAATRNDRDPEAT
jgi:hypothetical protein